MMDKEAKQIIQEGQRLILPIEGTWFEFRKHKKGLFRVVDEQPALVRPDMAKEFYRRLELCERNPLQYFLPHSGQRDFLNDYDNGWCFLLAPNQVGKTKSAAVWASLRLVPTDPDWDIFKYNGVDYHEWRGARRFVAASYSWDNVHTLYTRYIESLPREELGAYAPNWGKYKGEHGAPKTLSFGDGRPKTLPLKCGSEVRFLCYSQAQSHWEGFDCDGAQLDEQCPRPKAIGLMRAFTTRGADCQIACSLTGHMLDDRPDTGASGWMKTELWDATGTVMGETVGRYRVPIKEVPDAIISKKQKEKLHLRWVVEPEKAQDQAKLREAEARYWGGWESGSGLVLYNFDSEIHKIPPIKNVNNPIVREATRYRGIDHGLSRPCACVWGMVFPWGDIVINREYYKKHGIIPQHAEEIVKLSGNKKAKYGLYYDKKSRASFDRFKEEFTSERYQASVLDSRSFASPGQESDRTIGQQYNQYGLSCRASKGWRNEKIVPQILAMLEPDPKKPHIMTEFYKRGVIGKDEYDLWLKARKGNPNMGARLYFTRDLNFTFKEIVRWANNVKTGKPEDKNDHIVGGALKYLIGENPKFFGDHTKLHYGGDTLREVDEEPEVKRKSRFKYIKGY
jgi:hypothetical protein